MTRFWKIRHSHYILQHKMVNIRQDRCELPDGRVIDDYYVVEEPDAALVFALTPERELIMVEQYKHGIGQICLELPGGYVDKDEDPAMAAQRELLEETGYKAEGVQHVITLVTSPTRSSNRIHIYLVPEPVQKQAAQQLDPNEDITIKIIPIDEVFALIHNNTIDSTMSIAGIFRAWHDLNNL